MGILENIYNKIRLCLCEGKNILVQMAVDFLQERKFYNKTKMEHMDLGIQTLSSAPVVGH